MPVQPNLARWSRERLRQELERLQRENDELRRQTAEKDQEITQQRKQIEDQSKKISDLERQLASRKKDSTNSSKPPSSDGPAAARRQKPARCRGRRKPGGQEGDPRRHRELEPLERVDQIVLVPSDCRHCGQPLPQPLEQVSTVGEVHRYHVSELPPLQAEIIEYQCHKVACPHCGQATRAELPAEVQISVFGPRLAGLIAYLTVGLRIPRRGVEQLLETVLGIQFGKHPETGRGPARPWRRPARNWSSSCPKSQS